MHICNVISVPFPPREGIGTYVYNLSLKLIEKGHKVTVITRGPWNRIQRKTIDNINVIGAPFIPIYPIYLSFHGVFVNKIIKKQESTIDIVHIHTPLPPRIKTKRPIITTIHTPMITDTYLSKVSSIYSFFSKISARYISYPLELKNIRNTDIVTTLTDSISKELIKEYGLNPDEITIIGNGVDEKFFYPKQKLEDKNNDRYILFVGRLDRDKGLFDIIESGKHLNDKKSNVYFKIVGEGRDLNILKKKTKILGLQDKIEFLGQIKKDRLLTLYQNATAFILPSYHEGLPTVLLEAMSCGIPIIATNVRGIRDVINPEKNGIIIPPKKPEKIAEAISSLLENKKLRTQLGSNARKTIIDKYTWDKVSDKILKCYELLVGN